VAARTIDVAAGKREIFMSNNVSRPPDKSVQGKAGRLHGTYHDIIMPAPYKAIFIFPTEIAGKAPWHVPFSPCRPSVPQTMTGQGRDGELTVLIYKLVRKKHDVLIAIT
jgi:hypothetical protein